MNTNATAFFVIFLLACICPATAFSNATYPLAKQGCRETCGDVTIPYPFGTTEGCYYDENFLITCNETYDPPLALLRNSTINVTRIRVLDGKLHISQVISRNCYKNPPRNHVSTHSLALAKFNISDTENKFVAVGCDALALIQCNHTANNKTYMTGCLSICDNIRYVVNGSCSGSGCCESRLTKGVNSFEVGLTSVYNHTKARGFNPCSFAFVVEEKSFNFSSNDLRDLEHIHSMPVVLDWSIGSVSCEQAQKNMTSYSCKGNSTCIDASNGSGYQCRCKDGYEGNPYHPDGCRDIKECDKNLHNCTNICIELEGGYDCRCPKGHSGDGRKGGTGCSPRRSLGFELSIGLGVGMTVLLMSIFWMYFVYNKWRLVKLKEKFFKQNGGLMLQRELSAREGLNRETVKIFSAEELKNATNNYDDGKIIGKGGYGTVYRGELSDGRVVAIKMSKVVDQSQIEQFINEVVVLSQINHRNVVRLLGCCLETEVPLLVYEYITNGTLFDHIHNRSKAMLLNWETRLRIAAETAGVLSYLHSSAAIPIIHRDIKSTNILLDSSYTAKVSDFGASRLVPLDEATLSTMVQGTLGYLDPEYLHTSQLTEKSDVYSFGVLFVELLTGEKAVSFEKPEKQRNLAMYFLSALREDRLLETLEQCMVKECKSEHLKEVADLAKRCLQVKGDDRPTMKEVAMELEGLMRETKKHPWMSQETYSEETLYLLGEPMDLTESHVGSGSGYDSMKDGVVLPQVGNGR